MDSIFLLQSNKELIELEQNAFLDSSKSKLSDYLLLLDYEELRSKYKIIVENDQPINNDLKEFSNLVYKKGIQEINKYIETLYHIVPTILSNIHRTKSDNIENIKILNANMITFIKEYFTNKRYHN